MIFSIGFLEQTVPLRHGLPVWRDRPESGTSVASSAQLVHAVRALRLVKSSFIGLSFL
ncbi:MAG: hypothetical protein BJ554DRAFT_711 [Olpidium bornovanus]|uniref:Uncharacterized protein n=1 Tax=Olpidium bornovanus TaxID=278681 RepID=A0A8H8DMX8_9FUNG|nr:MAG: hypothetical protein BJ554DRAFT_711 [Olpidium bornovanus]